MRDASRLGRNMKHHKRKVRRKRKTGWLGLLTSVLVVITFILVIKYWPFGKKTEPTDAQSSDSSIASGETTPQVTSEGQGASKGTASQPAPGEGEETFEAVFLGVQNYGAPETKKENAEQFRYRFSVDGEEKTYAINNALLDSSGNPAYPVQNELKEGYSFQVTLKDGVIVDVTEIPYDPAISYTPVVQGTPGEKTVINFIKTSLMPVGTTLYVFGGGWDWQDTGSAIQARTLGVSDDWVRFFRSQDENYTFRDKDDDESQRDPTTSYYPFGGYNEYYYAGLDCSGFVGWTIYNTFETEDGKPGYVGSASKMAKRFSDYGWGAFSKPDIASGESGSKLKPGDIISIKGHVWISLGTCDDGSVLIVHSTNGFVSRTGQPGGGVALAAIGDSKDCEAYRLADTYMEKYYPEWYSRYTVALSSPDKYFNFESEDAGRFSWDTTSGDALSDDLGARGMTPEQILKYCYGEK
ncbi:MAG: hypothetical protein J5636_05830 [Clostridiales bacterium]|nr:hypothetical protein [Clostridiales bacterium]